MTYRPTFVALVEEYLALRRRLGFDLVTRGASTSSAGSRGTALSSIRPRKFRRWGCSGPAIGESRRTSTPPARSLLCSAPPQSCGPAAACGLARS
jgi:hypothetical protein